jgi:hypothetical protein
VIIAARWERECWIFRFLDFHNFFSFILVTLYPPMVSLAMLHDYILDTAIGLMSYEKII